MPKIKTAQEYAAYFIKLYSEYKPGRESTPALENERLEKYLNGEDVEINFKNNGRQGVREADERMNNGVNYGHGGKHGPKEQKTDIDKLLDNLDKPQKSGPIVM